MRGLSLLLALVVGACTSPSDAPEPSSGVPSRSIDTPVDTADPHSVLTDTSSSLGLATSASSAAASVLAKGSAEEVASAGSADRRYAVLVGINDYPGEAEDLPSGRHDVEAMRDVLIETFGYRPENIRVLTDRRASRGQIRRAFQQHLAQAGSEGSALFYFSGHGLQTDSNRGSDVEADGQDEALYVWAEQGERGATLLDDELGAWADALATDRVLVVLDACHSGTGTRGPDGWIHGRAPKGVRYADVASSLDPPGRTQNMSPLSVHHTLLAAARDREVALSGLPGEPSLFTAALTEALREADSSIGLADLMDDVRQTVEYRSNQFRSKHTPQLEGRDYPLSDVFGTR